MTARAVLDGIKQSLRGVTPGPWHLDREEPGEVSSVVAYAHNDGITIGTYVADTVEEDADAVFIAAAPTTVARLVEAVESVLRECDYLDTLADGDKHYAKGFRTLIENALTKEGQ